LRSSSQVVVSWLLILYEVVPLVKRRAGTGLMPSKRWG
jgi:hypothetical protein